MENMNYAVFQPDEIDYRERRKEVKSSVRAAMKRRPVGIFIIAVAEDGSVSFSGSGLSVNMVEDLMELYARESDDIVSAAAAYETATKQ